jgi:hypothetical protein
VAACPLQLSRSMVVVFGLEDVGYGYVIKNITVFTLPLPLTLTFVNILLVYACSSLKVKHNIWLN